MSERVTTEQTAELKAGAGRSSQDNMSETNEETKTELIHIAAILLRFTVPTFPDHWDWCKTTPIKERQRIIAEFCRVDDLLKEVAVRMRGCADRIS